ncbi:hypothetical protein GCM10010399_93590 [Dactylosporangium fulvum]|uniref:DUF2190 family protein n=1 Tax=Dactylosporangium fulvum TaxID=53359 RepID=A0ABY5W8K6_9ACTN|nr:capsid cement protein [Dactylosporangium fulvum]UWP85887.1 hypothetical protein Dfulv_17210 [Dactylosporangium fulvum]
MAKNITRELGDQLAVPVSHPTNPKSGDPVRWGGKGGVALADKDPKTGKTTVKFNGAATIPVKGINGSGNSAVADGDDLFYTDGDTPPVSKKATGTKIGNAMGAVGSGATATIEVRLAG